VENYNDIPVTVDIGNEKLNLETNKIESRDIELEPYGVRIYKKINYYRQKPNRKGRNYASFLVF
jgi:hypothetical protein